MPKISVIVPVYNVERYLPHCIDSILAQTYTDFELLLINDGSKDDSGKICDEYAKINHQIRVFHKENGGVSSARNVGIDNSVGEWLVFADADDYFTPNAFVSFAKFLDLHYDFILFNAIKCKGSLSKKMFNYTNCEKPHFFKLKGHAVWAHLFRKSVIDNNKLYFNENLAYSEDLVFLYKYLLCSKCNYTCEDIVYIYRINENSACASHDGLKIAQNQFIAAKEINCIINQISTIDIIRTLQQEIDNLLCAGIYNYIFYGMSYKTFKAMKEIYFQCMGNKFKYCCIFYYYLATQAMLAYRRRIIQFHKI